MRKIIVIVLTATLTCIISSSRLADASYEKSQTPLPISLPPAEATKKYKVLKRLKVYVTAYYGPECDQSFYAHGTRKKDIRINGAGIETRSGKFPKIGFAAADWRVLKQGTKFRIIGCKVLLGKNNPVPVEEIIFTVEDTGGGVKGKHVDIFTGHGEHACKIAMNFDCRKYEIEVVE